MCSRAHPAANLRSKREVRRKGSAGCWRLMGSTSPQETGIAEHLNAWENLATMSGMHE